MLSLPFVTLALALLANAAPMVLRDTEEPVVTTIITWRDCNYGKPPGAPKAPCPKYPHTEIVTLSPTGGLAEPTLTVTETEPAAEPTASETATDSAPDPEETASETDTATPTETEPPVTATCTTSTAQPSVTTIWEERDCNYGKPPGAPKAPCPPYPWSTVVTITQTATTTPPVTTSLSSGTTSAGEPIVTTIVEQRDCNYGKPPGAPKAPCPPYPWSTVITITPTPTTSVPTTTPTSTSTPDWDLGEPETEEDLCPPPPGWDSGKLYVKGDNVYFHTLRYTALGETLGDLPDNNTKGVWKTWFDTCSIDNPF